MSAFMDARCPKCNNHIGWCGSLIDHPGCHKCGWRPDPAELAVFQAKIDEQERLILELHEANPAWRRWRDARVSAGLTLRPAAELLGVTAIELSAIEQGKSEPTREFAERMKTVFGGETTQ